MSNHRLMFTTLIALASLSDPQGARAERSAKRVKTTRAPRTIQRVDSLHPLGVVLLVDRSASTESLLPTGERTIAQAIAGSVNLTQESMLAFSQAGVDEEAEGGPRVLYKPYFKVAAIGYNDRAHALFGNQLQFHSLDELHNLGHTEDDGHMTWVRPVSSGNTNMPQAFAHARPLLEAFVAEHPDSPPPIVINVTDGKPYVHGRDLFPETLAEAKALQEIGTKHGKTLVMNLHFLDGQNRPLLFPESTAEIDENLRQFGDLLFNMSSKMPPWMKAVARRSFEGHPIGKNSRLLAVNVDGLMLPRLLELGTVQASKGQQADQEDEE